jgi:hypothetical protein
MLVVCKIIVIQNGPSTHVIDATSLFKSIAERAVKEELRLLVLSSACSVGFKVVDFDIGAAVFNVGMGVVDLQVGKSIVGLGVVGGIVCYWFQSGRM